MRSARMVALIIGLAACSSGPPPLEAEAVQASVEAACAQAAAQTEELPPIVDEASLDAVFLAFNDVDREPWLALLDLVPAEVVRADLEDLVEGVRLVRFGAREALTAWTALDAEELADVRGDVERGSELLLEAAERLDAPSCTPQAWDVAFVLEALTAADAGVAGAAPTGVYRDDVDAACVRFTERILRAFPAAQNAVDQYVFLSRIQGEAQYLGEFLDRLDPVPDLAAAHGRLRDAAERLRLATSDLAGETLEGGAGYEEARAEALAALEEVDAAFDALDLPCVA